MSFDLGRKLGLAASLMAVIVPILIGLFIGGFVLKFSTFLTTMINGGLYSVSGSSLISLDSILVPMSIIVTLTLAAFLLFTFAMKRLSQYYTEPAIFKKAFYGFIFNLVGLFCIIGVAVYAVIYAAAAAKPFWGDITSVTPMTGVERTLFIALFFGGFVFEVISALFNMLAFNKLSEKSGIRSFSKAGVLYFIGIALTVAIVGFFTSWIVLIGGLVFWIAWVYSASGFNSLKSQWIEAPVTNSPQP